MSYVDGFIAAVPAANKQAYIDHSKQASTYFQEGEVVVFAWLEWPSKAVRDAGMKRMMEDPRMAEMGDMPFDGKRLILGGFETLLDVQGDR